MTTTIRWWRHYNDDDAGDGEFEGDDDEDDDNVDNDDNDDSNADADDDEYDDYDNDGDGDNCLPQEFALYLAVYKFQQRLVRLATLETPPSLSLSTRTCVVSRVYDMLVCFQKEEQREITTNVVLFYKCYKVNVLSSALLDVNVKSNM